MSAPSNAPLYSKFRNPPLATPASSFHPRTRPFACTAIPRPVYSAEVRPIPYLLAASLALSASLLHAQQPLPYQDPKLPAEQRITDLLSRMTLDEKVSAFSTDPSIPRLGVVGVNHVEGLHGLALGGPGHWEGRNLPVIPTTTVPQARGLGQTWDPALLAEVAAEEGFEARYALGKYHRGGLVMRAPNADLSRDPRWGRSEESYGEDPYLVGTLATAFTRGLQGPDPNYWLSASLLKHFLANSNEDGRGSSSSNFDTRLFHEYYAVPFRMAIEQGHSNAFMTAYNAWNGTPMEVNPVLRNVVMKDWGFNGIICTDGGALGNLVKLHHAFPNLADAAAASIKAGINQFLDDYKKPTDDALAQHLLTEADLDQNLRGVYRVMLKLGLLDPASPYSNIGHGDPTAPDPWNLPKNHALARRATDESIVLLKNTAATLPLSSAKLRSIAVIGPLADKVILDWYSGTPPYTVTPFAGIKARAGAGVQVTYADGKDIPAAAALAAHADVAIVIIGNHPWCDAGWEQCPTPSDGKEAVDRKSLTLAQEDIAKAVYAANPHTILVLQASFPYTTNWSQANLPAILTMTHNSEEQGTGLADVLFGDTNPGGHLTQTWPADMADLPAMMDYNLLDGRTYLYSTRKPLYPFGFGLSYTTFAFKNLRLSTETLHPNQTLTATVELTNTGHRAGDEVVQLYVSHKGSSVPRPQQELKAFERVTLAPGQTKTVTLPVPAANLTFWSDSTHSFVLDKDQIEIKVGNSSDSLPLTKTITATP